MFPVLPVCYDLVLKTQMPRSLFFDPDDGPNFQLRMASSALNKAHELVIEGLITQEKLPLIDSLIINSFSVS